MSLLWALMVVPSVLVKEKVKVKVWVYTCKGRSGKEKENVSGNDWFGEEEKEGEGGSYAFFQVVRLAQAFSCCSLLCE